MEGRAPDILDHSHDRCPARTAETPATDERDSVLANAIRRVTDAARRPPQEIVAAFQNFA